jgi:hypothetical protein
MKKSEFVFLGGSILVIVAFFYVLDKAMTTENL